MSGRWSLLGLSEEERDWLALAQRHEGRLWTDIEAELGKATTERLRLYLRGSLVAVNPPYKAR